MYHGTALDNRGDPFIGGLIKKGIGAIVGASPIGQLARVGVSAYNALKGGKSRQRQMVYQRAATRAPRGTAGGSFAGLSAGGPGGLRFGVEQYRTASQGVRTTGTIPQLGGGGECPAGYHKNKSGYFTKSGGYVAPGSKCVKNRRMNVGNSKALRKGIRRASGFGKLAKRTRKTLGDAYRAVK